MPFLVALLLAIVMIAVIIVVVFFVAAAIWGMIRGVKQIRDRDVQVQDKTLPPPT